MLNALKKYSYANNAIFYKSLLKLAIPMGFTSLLGALVNMLDTLMISFIPHVGEVAVAAVASANRIFFLMTVTLYGVFSGFGVFVSQYHGKKDIKRLQTVYMTSLFFGLIISGMVTYLSLTFPREVIDFFSDDPEVIRLGVEYLPIVSISFIISAILFSFEMVSRSTENVSLPLFNSIIGLFLNAGLNYVLIFGAFGAPAMGVKGAAIATVTARVIQLIIYLILIIYSKNQVLKIKLSNFIYESKQFKRMALRVTPVVINEFVWALGITLLFKAYGIIGTDAQAAVSLFDTFVGVLTVFTWGVANASAIMLGKRYGEKNYEEAKRYSKLFIFSAIIFGMFTGIIILISVPFVPFVFSNLSQVVITNIQYLLLIVAFWMPIKLLAGTFVVGILRSGGDTIFAFLADVGTLWVYAVPVAFLLVSYTPLSLPIIYILISVEEIIKDIICFYRYRSGKYLHNLVH